MDFNELLHTYVQDAVADWDEPFFEMNYHWGRLMYNPPNKYNYIVENLGWY